MKNILLKILMLGLTTNVILANDYNPPEILARANFNDGFNLPPMSFFNDVTPAINNRGDITFKVMTSNGSNSQSLWIKTKEDVNGKILYTAPDERFITDPSINDQGKIAFNLFDDGVTDGLFIFDPFTFKAEQVLKPDEYALQDYTYPQFKSNGDIYFRGTDDDDDRHLYLYSNNKLQTIFSEGVETNGSTPSYIFKLSSNQLGQVAFKMRIGKKGQWDESNPDDIVLLTPTKIKNFVSYQSKIIARDMNHDPSSPYFGFGNSISLSTKGQMVFIAVMNDAQKTKSLILADANGINRVVAHEGEEDISEIEMFSPIINENGLIAFRAKDHDGKRSIFLINEKQETTKLISEGSPVTTDLGVGKILSNPNYPGFGGGIGLNDEGVMVFHCLVVSLEDEREWGSAIFKLTPKK